MIAEHLQYDVAISSLLQDIDLATALNNKLREELEVFSPTLHST